MYAWWGGRGGSGYPYFFIHISSSWEKIWLYTENQHPRLSGSVLNKMCGVGGVDGWGGADLEIVGEPGNSLPRNKMRWQKLLD